MLQCIFNIYRTCTIEQVHAYKKCYQQHEDGVHVINKLSGMSTTNTHLYLPTADLIRFFNVQGIQRL